MILTIRQLPKSHNSCPGQAQRHPFKTKSQVNQTIFTAVTVTNYYRFFWLGSESELVSSTETETLNSQETEPKADAIVINAEATTKTAIKQLSNATDEIVEANNSQAVKSNDDKKNE